MQRLENSGMILVDLQTAFGMLDHKILLEENEMYTIWIKQILIGLNSI